MCFTLRFSCALAPLRENSVLEKESHAKTRRRKDSQSKTKILPIPCIHDFLIVLALILADASIHVQNPGLCGGLTIKEDAKTHPCNIAVWKRTPRQPWISHRCRGYLARFGSLDGFRDRQVPIVSFTDLSNRYRQIRRRRNQL